MYLRFVSPLRTGRRGVHSGIFQAAFHCRDDIDMPAFLHRQLIEEIDWFKDHLPSPDHKNFAALHDREFHWESICWFKSSADQMIARAWSLKALVQECGLPLSVAHSRRPGHICYEDKYQIVAYPRRDQPIVFG